MTGGRCHRRKKMMGRGPDGGCGTDERPCRPISKVSASNSFVKEPEIPQTTVKKPTSVVDLFSQARKALSERSPFDVSENASASGVSSFPSVSTLPSGLANLLRHSDGSRKRHKRSHSGADKKSSSRASERTKGGNIWAETEEYFRQLTLPDIDALFELYSSFDSLDYSKCFYILYTGNEKTERIETDETNLKTEKNEKAYGNAHVETEENDQTDTKINVENATSNVNVDCVNGNGLATKDEVNNEQLMEIDTVATQSDGAECGPQGVGKACIVSDLSGSVEWLLGCRNRNLLTSERRSRKRKLLGSDVGLEKVLVGCPCEGKLCDFCCKGEVDNDSNRLIVCSSCKVAVHLKCYGVQGDVNKSWLCSWCNMKSDRNDYPNHPCVLCPKQGGALKPVNLENGGGSVLKLAHLLCSLWMPEVYVEDITKMEPIMNVGGIKETRRKLVCNVCKVKCGTCIRCSHGTCRTAFHPICAREARHRMEIWGKYGSNIVELRAFCSKHSELPHDREINSGRRSVAASLNPLMLPMDKQQKLNLGRNGDKFSVDVETSYNNSGKTGDVESRDTGFYDSIADSLPLSESGDVEHLVDTGTSERGGNEGSNLSDTQNLVLILKKLIDQGKVNVEELAAEIGISSHLLISTLAEINLAPDLLSKIGKWFENHVYLGSLHKNLKIKQKSKIRPAEIEAADLSDCITVTGTGIVDAVAIKSVPPRRRTQSNVRILRDNTVICSPEEVLNDNGILIHEVKVNNLLGSEEPENSGDPNVTKKIPDVFQDSMAHLPKSEGGSVSERIETRNAAIPEQSNPINTNGPILVYSDVNFVLPHVIKPEAFSSFYVHPYIHEKLLQIQSGMLLQNRISPFEGPRDREISRLEASSSASVCCDHENKHSKCNYMTCNSSEVNSEQMAKAKKLGVFKLSPVDEVEGEIIYFQQRLLVNAVTRKHFTDNLISKVARHLPQEIDVARVKRWDAVLVNQYLCDVREAKKQGRKERRHKEAQAVLAAATAAAAASSRTSSFRKDIFDESAQQEKYSTPNGRAGISSHLMPRPKEMLSRVAIPMISSDKYSDFVQSIPDFSKDHPRSCDICRRSETILNPILVCSGCKVAVHLDCYRCVKESTGPWHCELCEELLTSRRSGAPINFWDRANGAECGLCGGITGAFRKSTDGRWVHAFCAEWVFEPTFRRGQVNPVEGMDMIAKEINICGVCHHRHGVCIKCSAGHCQITFHPTCARSAGFYMNVKTVNGKMQHKAYCEKHSLEQRAKAETQKLGEEEIKSMRLVRGQLERLRLLCERIVRREKIKRELVLCSHNILACKRDQVARSVLVCSPFFTTDVSSESATTSLKGNTDGYKSCIDAVQRSDDVTVDSSVSVKHRIKVNVTMDTDQKTDDSSTSQNLFTSKPTERIPFAGKQIPQRSSSASRHPLDEGEWSSKSKSYETFEKELVMTSDEASMKNQKLPKGYFYIPVDCLPKEKQINQGRGSGEPLEHDG